MQERSNAPALDYETRLGIAGLIAAVHSPFDAHGDLYLEAIEKQASHLIHQGIYVAFICGSTGESHSLSLIERKLISERWFEVTRGTSLQVIVHVGGNCLRDAHELAYHAAKGGAMAIAALSPSYFKPASVSDLVESMSGIAAKAPETPFYFYDIPVLTGVKFSMPEFLGLAKDRIPSLAGIKFTNDDLESLRQCLQADDGRWDILWGIDEKLLEAMNRGARGAVGSSYNFAAAIYYRLMRAKEQGDMRTAALQQQRAVDAISLLAGFGYLPAAKFVMELLGVPVGPARLPLKYLTTDDKQRLQVGLDRLGFFDWIGQ